MSSRHDRPERNRSDEAARGAVSRRGFLRRSVVLGAGVAAAGSLTSLGAAPVLAAPEWLRPGSVASVIRKQEAPRRGGSFGWASNPIPIVMDPIWSQARIDGNALSQIIEGLVRANARAELEPALAERWAISEDGLTYTFYLRQGVKFHNGKTLGTEDVLASLERSRNMGTYKWTLENVDTIKAVGSDTIEIVLKNKVASFLARLAINANAIFPKEEIDRIGSEQFAEPIGTGPFKVAEFVRQDHLTLKRNDDYWDVSPEGNRVPYLDELVIKQVTEASTQVLQVQSGTIQGSEGVPWSQIAALENDTRTQLQIFPTQQVYFMVVRVDRPPFDDVKVRQAMSLALDRQVFVNVATAGKAEVANSFMPRSGLYWNPDASLPYDVDRAKQLMAQSKYPNGGSGLKLQLTSGSALGRDNAVIAKDMWAQIGIDVTIEEVEGSTLTQTWLKGEYDTISGYQWTNGMADPEQLAVFFFVEPRMNSGYQPSQSTIDLCKAASAELDPDRRRQMYYDLQRIYNEDVGGTISLYYTPSVNYLSSNVRGFFRTPLGTPYFKWAWMTS